MALETNLNGLWGAKQTAKGTPATAPSTATTGARFRVPEQWDLAVNRNDEAEAFSDLDMWGDAQDVVTQIMGQGTPPIQGTPDELAWLIWMFNGGETVNAIVGPPAKSEHVSVPTTNRFWGSYWKRVGVDPVERQRFADALISQLVLACGTGQRILRVTPTIMSLDPGEKIAADPTLGMPAVDAFVWAEADGALELGGSVFEGATQYTLTLNKNLGPLEGQGVRPYDLQPGTPTLTLSCSMALDAEAFALANKVLYGTETPVAGAKPTAFVGDLSAFEVTHTQKDSDGADTGNIGKLEVPGWKIDPPDAVAVPNPAGGGGTLELAGPGRKSGASPMWRSTITCDHAAFTA